MQNVKHFFSEAANKACWTDDTQRSILEDYIGEHCSKSHYEKYLYDRALQEVESTEDVIALENGEDVLSVTGWDYFSMIGVMLDYIEEFHPRVSGFQEYIENRLKDEDDEEDTLPLISGMLVDIYGSKDGSECSNEGVSSKFTKAILFGDGVAPVFTFDPSRQNDLVLLKLDRRYLDGKYCPRVIPCDNQGNPLPGWSMFGGCFVWSCDSRFRQTKQESGKVTQGVCEFPVPLHDRFE